MGLEMAASCKIHTWAHQQSVIFNSEKQYVDIRPIFGDLVLWQKYPTHCYRHIVLYNKNTLLLQKVCIVRVGAGLKSG